MRLFFYLNNEWYVFLEAFTNYLGQKILEKTFKNMIDVKNFISKLTVVYGKGLPKIERMLQDQEHSGDLMIDFKKKYPEEIINVNIYI